MKLNSVKAQLVIFLALFAIFLSVRDRDTAFLLTASLAGISALAVESAIAYFKNRKITFSDSAVISGLIIGFVLSSENRWWIFVLAAAFAIGAKYLIRARGKHLFNPAAFGIFLTTVLFGASTQWRGTHLWYILAPAGLYFIYRVRKLELLSAYLLTSLGLFGIQAFTQKINLLNIFGYLSYFYIFIMLIEPKTTPIKPIGKLIFGMTVAILIFILTEIGIGFDAELCALLVSNLAAPVLDKLSVFRKEA